MSKTIETAMLRLTTHAVSQEARRTCQLVQVSRSTTRESGCQRCENSATRNSPLSRQSEQRDAVTVKDSLSRVEESLGLQPDRISRAESRL